MSDEIIVPDGPTVITVGDLYCPVCARQILSARRMEILAYLLLRKSSINTTASMIGLAPSTVRSHCQQIRELIENRETFKLNESLIKFLEDKKQIPITDLWKNCK